MTAQGALDDAGVQRLQQELRRLPPAGDVIVDVGELTFADSQALDSLPRIAARLRRDGTNLTVICDRQPTLRKILRWTGVRVADEREAALRHVIGVRLLARLQYGDEPPPTPLQ